MEQSTWFVIKPKEEDIEHHGVKGQKHGERRYQNKDGSLTPLGRIHYGYGQKREGRFIGGPTANDDGPTVEGSGTSRYERSTSKAKTASKRDYRNADDDTTTSSREKKQKKQDNSKNPAMDGKWESVGGGGNKKPPGSNNSSGGTGSNSSGGDSGKKKEKYPKAENAKLKSKLYSAEENLTKDLNKVLNRSVNKATQKAMDKLDLSDLSDDELRERINRYNLERSYKQIAVGDVATGRQRLQSTLEVAGSILAVGASAATIASIIHEMRKR